MRSIPDAMKEFKTPLTQGYSIEATSNGFIGHGIGTIS